MVAGTKGRRGIAPLILSFNPRWGWVGNAQHGRLIPGKELHYPQYRRLCGPQSQSELVWRRKKVLPARDPSPKALASRVSLYKPTTLARPPVIGEITEFTSIKCKSIYQMCQVPKILHR
jgi:hypothetical protein